MSRRRCGCGSRLGRAQTYASARALVVITLVMVVVLLVASPDFMEPYDSLGGQFVLLVAGGLFAGAVWSLVVMSRPVPVPRVLAGIEEVRRRRLDRSAGLMLLLVMVARRLSGRGRSVAGGARRDDAGATAGRRDARPAPASDDGAPDPP